MKNVYKISLLETRVQSCVEVKRKAAKHFQSNPAETVRPQIDLATADTALKSYSDFICMNIYLKIHLN